MTDITGDLIVETNNQDIERIVLFKSVMLERYSQKNQ